ncbi:MAG: split soret cytochrome c precursor [Archaeoglobales archaeon]|nr:MAG: split soret cytochrome c precursor [Archaeoglobales archaeon]
MMGDKMLTRRGFLKLAGTVAAVTFGLGCAEREIPTTPTATTPTVTTPTVAPAPELPWPYVKLDVEKTRRLGYLGYHKGLHCAAGAFYGIVVQLQEKVGYPWTQIPIDMYHYGAGGVVGWAVLCGALNGASGAINLAAGEDAKEIVNELMGWYTEFPFPSDQSNSYTDYGIGELPKSVSKSTLCHVSVTEWCKVSGYASGSKERSERCARLTGDVAAKAVELLNAWKDGKFEPTYELPDEVKQCRNCHYKGKNFTAGQFTRGKMNCMNCHVAHKIPPE